MQGGGGNSRAELTVGVLGTNYDVYFRYLCPGCVGEGLLLGSHRSGRVASLAT